MDSSEEKANSGNAFIAGTCSSESDAYNDDAILSYIRNLPPLTSVAQGFPELSEPPAFVEKAQQKPVIDGSDITMQSNICQKVESDFSMDQQYEQTAKVLVSNDISTPCNVQLAGNTQSLYYLCSYQAYSSPSLTVSNSSARSEEFTQIEHQQVFDQRNLNSEQAERVDESNGQKKRKKKYSKDDGCKRCNCKKTNCLKLYCECFAAGMYCDKPCSCKECLNTPDYEDTVGMMREQIETQNPRAFAPKIIHHVEDGDELTPIGGKHKKGCNCKKSMCLKGYCECYQAKVGCTSGCRCEGCENVYGKKGVYKAEITNGINEKPNGPDMMELEAIGSRLRLPELHNPQTPLFQHSEHGINASNYVPSGQQSYSNAGQNLSRSIWMTSLPNDNESLQAYTNADFRRCLEQRSGLDVHIFSKETGST